MHDKTINGKSLEAISAQYFDEIATLSDHIWHYAEVQFETPKTQADGLYEQVLEMCREQYRGIDSYQETSEANEMKINISDGADLLECKIKEAQTSVQVVITKVW